MPEVFEISMMVKMTQSYLNNLIIHRIFYSSFKHKGIPVFQQTKRPFSIVNLTHRGKEIALSTSKGQHILIKLGSGSFFVIVETWKLGKYPFDQLSGAIFYGYIGDQKYSLVFLDCEQFKNFPNWSISEGKDPHWSPLNGPCVLTQHSQFHLAFLKYWREHPDYFKERSITHVLFDPSLFNGLGQYSISEILHRMFIKLGITPWDNSFQCFSKYMDTLLKAPLNMENELSLYSNHYDPTIFGIKQRQQRTEFRCHFLQVYRKKQFLQCEVICLMIHINVVKKSDWKTLYTVAKHPQLPSKITSKRAKKEKARLNISTESWYRIKGSFLTINNLGVGYFDWYSVGAQNKLKKRRFTRSCNSRSS